LSSPSANRSPTVSATSWPASAPSCALAPAGWIQSLLLDGAWKALLGTRLPAQILLLFLFIGILEDSGYLARAALIADRVMRTTGLNGKAFIPLLSATPAPSRPSWHPHHREPP